MSWSSDSRRSPGGQLGWFPTQSSTLHCCMVVFLGLLGSGCGAPFSKAASSGVRPTPPQERAVEIPSQREKQMDKRWEALWSSPNKVASTSHMAIQHIVLHKSSGTNPRLFSPKTMLMKRNPQEAPLASVWLAQSGREEKTVSAVLAAADYGASTYRVAMQRRSSAYVDDANQEMLQEEKKPYDFRSVKGKTQSAKSPRVALLGRHVGCSAQASERMIVPRVKVSPAKKPCLPKLAPFSYDRQEPELSALQKHEMHASASTKRVVMRPTGTPDNTGLDWMPSTPKHIGMPRDPRFRWVKRNYGGRFWGFTWVMLKRRSLFEKRMRPLLRKEGVPEELFLLTGVESNYNVRLMSRAYAVGVWQIVRKTGLRYGLRVTPWIDERRHIEKATVGAARYLRDLYQRYGQWEWALAAYNCGEWCVDRAIKRCPGATYWQARLRWKCGLPQETKDYVSRFYSVLYYYRNYPSSRRPVWTVEPVDVVKVKTPGPVRLREVADAIGLSLSELFYYNSELSSWTTPPGERYPLLLPAEYASKARAYFAGKGQEALPWRWTTVKVGADKAIQKIARRYDLTSDVVSVLNRIRGKVVPEERKQLILPVLKKNKKLKKKQKRRMLGMLAAQVRKFRWQHPALRLERKLVPCYRVRRGDSWKKLSRRHGVSVKLLMHYNGYRALRKGSWIRLRQWARCHHKRKRKKATSNNVALLTSKP